MIIVHATIPVRPEGRDAFVEVVRPLLDASRAEAGNLAYDLYESAERTGEYIVVERWESLEALQAHFTAEHFTAARAAFPDLVAGPSDVTMYETPGPLPMPER